MSGKPDLEQLKRGGVVKLKEKDQFSVWVRAVCCNMDAVKFRKVAELAERYGRGIILLTTRQFPIIPFVHFNDLEAVQKELKEVNLMLDRCGARVRNSDVCYDSNICPLAVTNPLTLGEKLDEFWQKDPGGHKIKTSIVGCPKQCTSPRVLSDIGFVGVAPGRFDVYVGGRLGLRPFIGEKMAEGLNEEECVRAVKNLLDFIHQAGREGERSADLINRLGAEQVKQEITKDLAEKVAYEPYPCDTRQSKKVQGVILRIRATAGEVTSAQARKIADTAEKYGKGFIHFAVRGSAEIPGINEALIPEIKAELSKVGLDILDSGIDNLQSCFGEYCTNGIVDAQGLLKKIEKIIARLGLDDRDIKISAAGCPNTCAISPISDIGFWGVIEPIVAMEKCNGCGICAKACKVNAIEIKEGKAVIDYKKCKWCMDCINACPFESIEGGRRGYAVAVGGRGGYSPFDRRGGETRLGKVVAEFLSEAEALELAEKLLLKIKSGEEI
ncbi:MAG: 4Fe-4S dicluster domain-containing protein [Candidatus Margulisiibacteriota bacterium]